MDVDNHMGLCVGFKDFCYQSYGCARLRVDTYVVTE